MARAAYVGSRNRNGRFTVSLNPAIATIPGATTGNTDARRQFAADGIGIVNLQVQDRQSNYNGLQLALTKRYSHGFQISSNYTLSKVVGDFAGERQLTGGEIIPYFMFQDPALMWGPLDQDHRHRFTTSWVMDLPGQGLSGPIALGARRLAVVGRDAVSDRPSVHRHQRHRQLARRHRQRSREADRRRLQRRSDHGRASIACGISIRRPLRPTISARSATSAKARTTVRRCTAGTWGCRRTSASTASSYVQARVEFFNIFNQVNLDVPNTAVNNQATLGRITRTDPGSGDPRILQFGLKFVF